MSLQDIILQQTIQHHQNAINADQTGNFLNVLAQDVSDQIKKRQAEKQAQQQREQEFKQFQEFVDSEENKSGNRTLIKKGSYDPITGKVKLSVSTPTPAERKIQREEQLQQAFSEAVSSGKSSIEIGKQLPSMASEIAELEELNVISPQGIVSQAQVLTPVEQTETGKGLMGDSVITERTPQGRAKTTISKSGKIEEAQIKAIGKVQEEQTKEAVKSIQSFNRVKQASAGMVAAAKRMIKEQGGFGLVQQLIGKGKRTLAKTGLIKTAPEAAQAGAAELRGQTREMVLSLSPILTNQNRVIQGVIDMLNETIPQPGEATTGTEFTAQLKQTTKNAFRLSKALATGAMTPEEISSLNEGELKDIQSTMKGVLDRTTWTKQDEDFFNEQWGEISQTPATVPEDIFSNQMTIRQRYGLE